MFALYFVKDSFIVLCLSEQHVAFMQKYEYYMLIRALLSPAFRESGGH